MTAGSDAHTLRRIGRTWTEAPGRTRDEFLRSLRQGLGPPGRRARRRQCRRTATPTASSRATSHRSSVFGPRDVHGWRRAACLAFSAVSLPVQFLPVAIAVKGKSREAREVQRADGRARAVSRRA